MHHIINPYIFDVTPPISAYSSMRQTFASDIAMFTIGGVEVPWGYDNTTVIFYDSANPISIYKALQDAGTYTTQATGVSNLSIRGMVNESGDTFFGNTSFTSRLYRLNAGGVLDYIDGGFTTVGAVARTGIVQTPINTGPDFVSFDDTGGESKYLSSINWGAHTCVQTALGAASAPAKQNANISGGRVYCSLSGAGAVGYVDTIGHSLVTLITAATIPSYQTGGYKNLIVGDDVNLYLIDGTNVKKFDNTGTLLGTYASGTANFVPTCFTSESGQYFLWLIYAPAGGMQYRKIRCSDMTLFASGSIANAHGFQWFGVSGIHFNDGTSPVFYTLDASNKKYLGKLIP